MRTYTYGRKYSDAMTKFSRIDGLPYFLINGAPLLHGNDSASDLIG